MSPRNAVWLLAVLLLASASLALAQGTYTQIDVPGASDTASIGLNNLGDVVGYYYDENGIHGFLFSAGVFTSLHAPHSGARATTAYGINDAGKLVGSTEKNGFVYDIRTQVYTTLRYSPATHTMAFAINNAGTIVGGIGSPTQGVYTVGFELSGTTYTTMKVPGAASTVLTSINNADEVLLQGYTSSGDLYYFLLDGDGIIRLNNPAGIEPYSINDSGGTAGSYALGNGAYAGFVKQSGVRQTLKFPGSISTYATTVNNADVVVGYFFDAIGYHGFLWTPPADAKSKETSK